MKKKQLKSYSLDEMKDKYIGKKKTPGRKRYEYELKMDVLAHIISKQGRNAI